MVYFDLYNVRLIPSNSQFVELKRNYFFSSTNSIFDNWSFHVELNPSQRLQLLYSSKFFSSIPIVEECPVERSTCTPNFMRSKFMFFRRSIVKKDLKIVSILWFKLWLLNFSGYLKSKYVMLKKLKVLIS